MTYNRSMQFKVPQNISMEDRIAGPLTMIQFIILVLSGGVAWLEYNILAVFGSISGVIAVFIFCVGAFLAVGQFNGQPMYRFFRYMLMFALTPRTRVWHKSGGPVNLIRPTAQVVKTEVAHIEKHVSKGDIARLAAVLDTRGDAGLPPPVTPKK